MMKLLALETSSQACTVALYNEKHILTREAAGKNRHTEVVLPMIDQLLAEAGLTVADLDACAWAAGPGAFTGLRVGASVIQGIAFAHDLPVINISTLQALAQQAFIKHNTPAVAVSIDARMNEMYWGIYQLNDETQIMESLQSDQLQKPAQVSLPEREQYFAIGTGWQQYDTQMISIDRSRIRGQDFDAYPRAEEIAILAHEAYRQGRYTDAFHAVPCYLRDQVVS